MNSLPERIDAALGALSAGAPRNLTGHLRNPGGDFNRADDAAVAAMLDLILDTDPNQRARLKFSDLLRKWDNAKTDAWIDGTPRNTAERRKKIHALLRTDAILAARIDELIPFYTLDDPLIIADAHHDWYFPEVGVRDYYWSKYSGYLREKRGWSDRALLNLDNSTRAIVECLANPSDKKAYASRGLVMGYVQSGKTANFAGVVARAADAGYRLIIVMAGTWNILRNQTQRRFDKELVGKELLANDESYERPPADWDEFLEHGADPADLGHYSWQRLTRPDIDFKSLKAAIDSLEFNRRDKSLPLYHPTNLSGMAVKLLVVKKHSDVLRKLANDLGHIRTKLNDIPALIIDDESDQAGINTVDPKKKVEPGKERTATNAAIVDLLQLLPRGQYVGYTATPYANALVHPDDEKDLFPRDFIISLDRPVGYMGVSDFFDPDADYSDLDPQDFSQPEIAFIRRVTNPQGKDDRDLEQALCSYVLAGALKLYRHEQDSRRYPAGNFKHHTMLVHTSALKGKHASIAGQIEDIWNTCAFNSVKGKALLRRQWDDDYAKVCAAKGLGDLRPGDFDELIPFLSDALGRIQTGNSRVLLVNGDSEGNPDFSQGPIWKIFVGGNKLSRGYTIEGLTVSYYRRVSNTGDTLMQMGRWFGFRPGYRDLVRVFLGVNEGKSGREDLVALFKEVCRTEENFREEIKRYVRIKGAPRITPRQIPPLIAVTGNLPPTARNKMHHAIIAEKNFGARWSQPTLTPAEAPALLENHAALRDLLASAVPLGENTLGGRSNEKKTIKMPCLIWRADSDPVMQFLTSFRWLETDFGPEERPADIGLQLEFLKKAKHGIASWLVLAPQRQSSFGEDLKFKSGKLPALSVRERRRPSGRGFQQFGEPDHRAVAEYLAGLTRLEKRHLTEPDKATTALLDPHRAILLVYPVRSEKKDEISIGFEIFYPANELGYALNFTVATRAAGRAG